MPPKFALNVALPASGNGSSLGYGSLGDGEDGDTYDLYDSVKLTGQGQGALQLLTKTYTEYRFTPEGMTRSGASQGQINTNNNGGAVNAAGQVLPPHHARGDSNLGTPGASTSSGGEDSGRGPTELFYQVSESDIHMLRQIGRGASSVVYKAYLCKARRFVAIKKINALEKERRRQLMNDIKALCAVQHASIVRFLGAYQVKNSSDICLVLDYMDAGSLAQLVAMRQREVATATAARRPVPRPNEALLSKISGSVLQGLVYLHRRHTIHRDIKPANILINSDGEAKITDFGISATVENTMENVKTFVGTSAYMSPERINSDPYSFASDIWSLGLTVLEVAMGKFPYDVTSGPFELMVAVTNPDEPVPLPPNISDEFRNFLTSCLQKDPRRRGTAEELLKHPFVTKHQFGGLGLVASIVAPCIDWVEKSEDAGVQCVLDYKAMREEGVPRREQLMRIYDASDVMLSYEGTHVAGLEAVLLKVDEVERVHAAFGGCTRRISKLYAQTLPESMVRDALMGSGGGGRSSTSSSPKTVTLGGGGVAWSAATEAPTIRYVLLHTEGTLTMRGAVQNGMGGRMASTAFVECFLMRVVTEPPPALTCSALVLRHMFSLLKSGGTSAGGGGGGGVPIRKPAF